MSGPALNNGDAMLTVDPSDISKNVCCSLGWIPALGTPMIVQWSSRTLWVTSNWEVRGREGGSARGQVSVTSPTLRQRSSGNHFILGRRELTYIHTRLSTPVPPPNFFLNNNAYLSRSNLLMIWRRLYNCCCCSCLHYPLNRPGWSHAIIWLPLTLHHKAIAAMVTVVLGLGREGNE